MTATCRCGHPETHHDAGECWTALDGTETWQGTDCPCSWFEPVGNDHAIAPPETDENGRSAPRSEADPGA